MSGVEGERPLDRLVLLTEFPMSAVLGIDANGIVYGVYSLSRILATTGYSDP